MSAGKTSLETANMAAQDDIAIIGMACLFPGARDLSAFWHNVVTKVDAVTDPPQSGWGVDVLYDPDSNSNDRVYCKRGGFLGPLAEFDPLEQGIMPLAVQGGEPDQWLALRVARSALADAGYGDDTLTRAERHRTAVILGKGTYLNRGNLSVVQHGGIVDQILEILGSLHPEYEQSDRDAIRRELKQHLPLFSPDTVPGLIPNIVAGRIANRLDLMGPSYTVDGACASSLLALDIAARDLLTGRCDLALVGGVHVVMPLPLSLVFSQLGALSRRQQISPFDRDADGTILGEGVGMVVLKRLKDAERDDHRIYAVVKGIGTSSDGRGLSVTAPRLEGEIAALRRAYEQSGISPRTIGLIEAHGTGTPVGDATEIEALNQVFGPREGATPRIAMGSVKSMIGHLLPAAGIAGLIKTALALYHGVLPPTLHVANPHPKLADPTTPLYINSEARPWIHNDGSTPRRAGVNAFGFGGINAHVILQEHLGTGNTAFESHLLDWDTEVCILAAASRSELVERAEQLRRYCRLEPEGSLKDLAYTLNVRLAGEPCRLAIVASSVRDLGHKLDRALERLADPERHQIKDVQGIYFSDDPLARSGRLAFVFPGEGSQYSGMLADLCIHFPEVRQHFDLIDRVHAEEGLDHLLSDAIFAPPALSAPAEGERLWQMEGAVGAVLTASHALSDLLGRLEVHPDAVVGHSTGEYSAMLAARMLDLDKDRIGQFAAELYRIYQQAAQEGEIARATLVAVGASAEAVQGALKPVQDATYVAMRNCPHQSVIVCQQDVANEAMATLQRQGLICEKLPFDRPYHTPLFEAYASRLRPFFARWLTRVPQTITYSCTTTVPFPDHVEQSQNVAVEHWLRPVAFQETIERMYADGIRIFVEVGPRGNLSAFINDILRGQPHLAVPIDLEARSGTEQLNHMLGLLAVHGVPMALGDLYARRSPKRLALDPAGETPAVDPKPGSRIKLETGWPRMELSKDTVAHLRAQAQKAGHRRADIDGQETTPSTPVDRQAVTAPQPGGASRVMIAHLQAMEQFLAVQQEVMQAYLSGVPAAPVTAEPAVEPTVQMAPASVPEDAGQVSSPMPHPAQETTQAAPVEQPPPATPGQSDAQEPLAAGPLDSEAIQDTVLRLVSERTGYPVEMLGLNLDLEAELGIDSIKRVEILGAFQQQTGPLEAEKLEALTAVTTLQGVIDFLADTLASPSDRDPAASAKAVLEAPVHKMPLVKEVISWTADQELVAVAELDLDEHLFLRDHSLGRDVSRYDPKLAGFPVMPLTMSLELLAEAAALLAPDHKVVAMRDVRAHRWIALEAAKSVLHIIARRTDSDNEINVRILESDGSDSPSVSHPAALEGTIVLAPAYPDAPVAETFDLRERRPSRWRSDRLYQDLMFHGPTFRGVVSMDAWGKDGAEATLQALSPHGLIRSDPTPSFVTDPVLLDQPGQVVGFWMDEHLDASYVVFPFGVDLLRFHGPPLAPGERVGCRARIERVSEREVQANLDIVRQDGRIWAHFEGWKDWRFDLPRAFIRFLLAPQEEALSEPWSTPTGSLPEGLLAHRLRLDAFPEGFFAAQGAVWQRALAYAVLSQRERTLWQSLRTPPPRRLEWLLGRVAGKDAVRAYLRQRHNLSVPPADIEILPDEHGRPVVQGVWAKDLPAPVLSLSHSGGVAVAVVGDGRVVDGIGVDVEPVGRLAEEASNLAFTPDEQALLASVSGVDGDSWPLRLWCAKEAVAKALGQGLVGGPRALVVESFDTDTGSVQVCLAGEMARRFGAENGDAIAAYTAHDDDLIVATSVHVSSHHKETEHDYGTS